MNSNEIFEDAFDASHEVDLINALDMSENSETTESNPTNINTEFVPETAPPTTSALSVNGMRYAQVESVQNFIESNENKNTRVKTLGHQKLFESFLSMQNETRKIHEIPPSELDEHLSTFFLSVRQKNGNEYEPVTLRNISGSFTGRDTNTGTA